MTSLANSLAVLTWILLIFRYLTFESKFEGVIPSLTAWSKSGTLADPAFGENVRAMSFPIVVMRLRLVSGLLSLESFARGYD